MKFKAGLRDPKALAIAFNIAKAFQKKCILKLDKKAIRIISQTGVSDGSQLWIRIQTDTVLKDLRLESSQQDNIWIEIADCTSLVNALRCCERSNNVIIKLAKADHRQLLKLSMQSSTTNHDISHEVEIRVLPEGEVQEIIPVELTGDRISLFMPQLQEVAYFIDKVKTCGCSTITLSGQLTPGGDDDTPPKTVLHFVAESMSAVFTAQFMDVGTGSSTSELKEDGQLLDAAVSVDIKKLAKFLAAREMYPEAVNAFIIPNAALMISAHGHAGTNLVYYMPANVGGQQ